ncbi:unnamed protein product [Lactuca virosa]|uniref:Uncharacterized protein n=1 Tax=Lactuca virosa TaxID=75947 RepID=A0AAU9LHJ0_9ASTR|nr:unnamed protein product [Lactuca virosa]
MEGGSGKIVFKPKANAFRLPLRKNMDEAHCCLDLAEECSTLVNLDFSTEAYMIRKSRACLTLQLEECIEVGIGFTIIIMVIVIITITICYY